MCIENRTLSQLLRHRKSFLESHTLPKDILRHLWLDKLSTMVTQILTTHLENADHKKMVEMANKICEGTQIQNVNTMQNQIL